MIGLTAGDCETEADGDSDAEDEDEGDADGEAPPGLSSEPEGEAEGEGAAVDADGAEEAEPLDSDFCGPQAVAASTTAVANPSVRIMTL
ncbi:hypothetical protein ACFWHQ_12950 [Streptomyces sp. NPDC060334]|uniref:hypothetical protein n=1 Tax=unclassified Streptomyces TaxID=2593676 RepID=UPI002B1D8745|nr:MULTISPECIES: hypothetical protein [unclassified Streptomyces]